MIAFGNLFGKILFLDLLLKILKWPSFFFGDDHGVSLDTLGVLNQKRFQFPKSNPGSHQSVLAVYQATASFPRDETYGLTAQIRRAAVSIASNIAEGCGRDGDAELARFCLIARGSASELEYQILLAHDLKLSPTGRYQELTEQITEIKRMLTVFVQKLTADR